MNDKTGREVRKGQLVDILINDILRAFVIEVKEETIIAQHGKKPMAQLMLNIAIPVTLNIGQEAPVYIVREAPEPEEEEPREHTEGPRGIM